MWFLPTHKRPQKIRRMLDSLGEKDRQERVCVLFWDKDPHLEEYRSVPFPGHWSYLVGPWRWASEKVNMAYAVYPDEPCYGFIQDDIEMVTKDSLPVLRRDGERGLYAWPNDLYHRHGLSAISSVIPQRMARALGWLAHPDFLHNCGDVINFRVARDLGILRYHEEIIWNPHLTDRRTGQEWDEAYKDGLEINLKARTQFFEFERLEQAAFLAAVKSRYEKLAAPVMGIAA
jgi:hypothetical protein